MCKESVHIYLAGGMSGLSCEEQCGWRDQLRGHYKLAECSKNPIFFSPPDYYSPDTNRHKSEREVMEFELNQLRKSDLVVVNFNAPASLGTAMELMLAKEHRIPVIGLNENREDLHPWLIECSMRIFNSITEMTNYLSGYFLR